MIKQLSADFSVSRQIRVQDVAMIKAQGFRTLFNNRIDGEDPHAPLAAVIRAEAERVGLDYVEMPLAHARFTSDEVARMRAILRRVRGPTLAYCQSGTRSVYIWALAMIRSGADRETIVASANAAGYALSALPGMLAALDKAA